MVVVLGGALVGLDTATPPRVLDPAEDGLLCPHAAMASARASGKAIDLDQCRGSRWLRGHVGSLPLSLARCRPTSDLTIAAPRAGIRPTPSRRPPLATSSEHGRELRP